MTATRDEAAESPHAPGPTGAATVVVRREPGPAERDPKRHHGRRRTIELTLAIGVPVLALALWQAASEFGWINSGLYPSPTDLLWRVPDLFGDAPGGHMGSDVWASVQRVLWGYLWGASTGLLLGYWMGMSRLARAAFEPMLNALYTVPKLALIGVFLLILGFNERPIIVVIALTVFFFVWISTMAAVMAVPKGFREAAISFGATRWQMFRQVIVPGSLPQVFVGLRVAAGVTVLTVIGVEFVFAPGGLGIGYRINLGRQVLDPGQMYVAIVIASLLGVVFVWLVRRIGRLAVPWSTEDEGTDVA